MSLTKDQEVCREQLTPDSPVSAWKTRSLLQQRVHRSAEAPGSPATSHTAANRAGKLRVKAFPWCSFKTVSSSVMEIILEILLEFYLEFNKKKYSPQTIATDIRQCFLCLWSLSAILPYNGAICLLAFNIPRTGSWFNLHQFMNIMILLKFSTNTLSSSELQWQLLAHTYSMLQHRPCLRVILWSLEVTFRCFPWKASLVQPRTRR